MSQPTCPIASKLDNARLRGIADGSLTAVDGEAKELACRLLNLQKLYLELRDQQLDNI